MPQNSHEHKKTMQIIIEDTGQDATMYTIHSLRHDIWIGMIPTRASWASLQIKNVEPVLTLAFLVPRMGKGGEGKLPAGSLCMFPIGTNTLPELSGRGLIICIAESRLKCILGDDVGTIPACVLSILNKKGKQVEMVHISLTPEQILAGNALILCNYEVAVRNLFFNGYFKCGHIKV